MPRWAPAWTADWPHYEEFQKQGPLRRSDPYTWIVLAGRNRRSLLYNFVRRRQWLLSRVQLAPSYAKRPVLIGELFVHTYRRTVMRQLMTKLMPGGRQDFGESPLGIVIAHRIGVVLGVPSVKEELRRRGS